MILEGALVKEQGVEFAIVIVKEHVLGNSNSREQARTSFSGIFPRVPLILMAQNSRGIPTYQGRTDIVKYLANINPSRIPWKRYTINH